MSSSADHAAVIATRVAYEAGAEAWAGRDLDRSYITPRLQDFARRVLALEDPAMALDLGCGPGVHASVLEGLGLAVTACDVTRAMLQIVGRQQPRARLRLQGDSRSLPFAPGGFAGVWASASLLHLPKSQVGTALAEVARTLRPGGVFYSAMKEGDQDGFDGGNPEGAVTASRFFAHYRQQVWSRLLERAGFAIDAQEINPDRRPGFPDWIVTFASKR